MPRVRYCNRKDNDNIGTLRLSMLKRANRSSVAQDPAYFKECNATVNSEPVISQRLFTVKNCAQTTSGRELLYTNAAAFVSTLLHMHTC